ncbi:hypothetical protein GSI_03490 [Ganoderma sinense ZZ0214-1]|uniref:Uncharacterized protein n=1 Tax=Ganoderma sinense ZZ0214-1 TaxID=1077348 RepID=A0A2G8SLT4_9APHY|nr:hypothetical protein GSI_03490 [Ganoderma sinense ZZ0214-1]
MANLTSTELVFLYDAATYALYTGNLALGQLASTLINSSMFGVLSLSALAAGALLVPRSRRDVRNISLLLATGAMYAGTTVYFALRLRNLSHDAAATFTNAVALFSDLQSCYLASIGATVSNSTQCTTSQDLSDLAGPSDLPPQYCAGTAALTINAVLGNAILCWRACALWPRRRMVPLVLGSLLLATCALGIADTRAACRGAAKEDPLTLDGPSVGSFYVGKNFGLAAASLAFVTVLAASALIGFRTWQLRAGIRARLRQGSARARMGGALALTVELGVVYCVIWGFIVGATATMDQSSGAIEDTDTGFEEIVYTPTPFVQGFWVFDLGALTPLTAIYPLLLVVVVALNKSLLFEHDRDGFERISDDAQRARALGEPRSPTQWRRKFLLASPQPALIDQRASGGAGVEAFALSHKRPSSGWEEVDVGSLGKGEVL